MENVFVDTDVILDLLAKRQPYYEASAILFSLADKGKIRIGVSSLSFSNLHYILSRTYSSSESRRLLNRFKVLVKVLAVNDKIVELALTSRFADFEDAIQYYTAIENNYSMLLTRNIKDYKHAEIVIMSSEDFIKGRG
ncbi:MAG: PIN domain-containing protein [Flavisolibacter sp.]|nr:PIN domain-containing protein [Flavisolibacter sp.]